MAILVKGKTFTSTEQVTSTKLHQLVDSATFDTGAVDNSTTALSGGAIIVKTGGITGTQLSATVAIPTGATAVTQAVDTNTTALATTAFAKKEADDAQAFAIQRANHTGTQGVATITGLGALATTYTAAQVCKAWVAFTTITSTSILGSGAAQYNVSSLTDGGVGITTVNFTNDLGTANYAAFVSHKDPVEGSGGNPAPFPSSFSSGSLTVKTGNNTTLEDSSNVSVAIFSN